MGVLFVCMLCMYVINMLLCMYVFSFVIFVCFFMYIDVCMTHIDVM